MRLNRLSALPVLRCAALLLAIICLGGSRGFAAVLTLPEGLRAVEDEAFAGLAAVTELVIPEGMESVGSRAFADSGLTEITLPATLTAIADDAFAGCVIVAAHAPYGSDAFAYCLAQGWFLTAPWSDELHIATYNGEAFKVVNTVIDPIEFAKLTYRRCCQAPNEEGINQYGGECLNFSYYYTHCMVDGVAELSIADALRRTIGNVRYTTEKNSNSQVIMARLYDLLNTGMPQILMVEALTHAGEPPLSRGGRLSRQRDPARRAPPRGPAADRFLRRQAGVHGPRDRADRHPRAVPAERAVPDRSGPEKVREEGPRLPHPAICRPAPRFSPPED